MSKQKRIRTRGKLKLSRIFQSLKEGDKVAIDRELSVRGSFPERIEGRTGTIVGKRGKAYIIKIRVYNQEKSFIINPIHLKKLR